MRFFAALSHLQIVCISLGRHELRVRERCETDEFLVISYAGADICRGQFDVLE